MPDPNNTKPAAYWLDKACEMEKQGNERAITALNAAIRIDSEEHEADPASASLPRASRAA